MGIAGTRPPYTMKSEVHQGERPDQEQPISSMVKVDNLDLLPSDWAIGK